MKTRLFHLLLCACLLAGCAGWARADQIRWRNGDVLPGSLLEIGEGRVHWASPLWPQPWDLDIAFIESIDFKASPMPLRGDFIVRTHAGDSFPADLVGADESGFLVRSPIVDLERIARDALWTMERLDDSNRVFLAEGYLDWLVRDRRILRNLRYRVHRLDEGWEAGGRGGRFTDFSRMELVAEGELPDGLIDFSVASLDEPQALVFEGEINLGGARTAPAMATSTVSMGLATFKQEDVEEAPHWAALRVGGQSIQLDGLRHDNPRRGRMMGPRFPRSMELNSTGWRPFRFQFMGDQSSPLICPTYSLPDKGSLILHKDAELPEVDGQLDGWTSSEDGRLRTSGNDSLFLDIDLPPSFEMEVEIHSSGSPRFSLGLGQSLQHVSREDSFWLETWDDALVATRGDFFEVVKILDPQERELRLRLCYDLQSRLLEVLDYKGALMARWEGAQVVTGQTTFSLQNEGTDLEVARICIYRTASGIPEEFQSGKRIRLSGGNVLPGDLLHDPETGRWIVASGESGRELDLEDVKRVYFPMAEAGSQPTGDALLSYGDGISLKGRLLGADGESLRLATELSEQPLEFSREGLAALQLLVSSEPFVGQTRHVLHLGDDLEFSGRLLSGDGENPLLWRPEGASSPQPLPQTGPLRIVANSPVNRRFADTEYPHMVRLFGNQSLYCRVVACGEGRLELEAPLLGRRSLPLDRVRAIEMDREPFRLDEENPRNMPPGRWIGNPPMPQMPPRMVWDPELGELIARELDPEEQIEIMREFGAGIWSRVGEETEEQDGVGDLVRQALRVPRFGGRPPPTHLVVARNGDVLRGELVSMDEEDLLLRTRISERRLGLDLVRQVVRIAVPGDGGPEGKIRVKLSGGQALLFEEMSAQFGDLVLQSGIHGRSEIPLAEVRELALGDHPAEPDPYRDWVVMPVDPGEGE